jgi:hypothetical protein
MSASDKEIIVVLADAIDHKRYIQATTRGAVQLGVHTVEAERLTNLEFSTDFRSGHWYTVPPRT